MKIGTDVTWMLKLAESPAGGRRRIRALTRADKVVGGILAVIVVGAAVVLSMSLAHPGGSTTTQSGPNEYEFATENATSSISARVGEVFVIQLNSNAGSTGFDWKVASSAGIHYINYTAVQEEPMMIGGEVRHYYFRALAAGNQTITLQNMRSWDPSQIPATIDIRVAVA